MPAIIEDETNIQISNTTSNCSKMWILNIPESFCHLEA